MKKDYRVPVMLNDLCVSYLSVISLRKSIYYPFMILKWDAVLYLYYTSTRKLKNYI